MNKLATSEYPLQPSYTIPSQYDPGTTKMELQDTLTYDRKSIIFALSFPHPSQLT